jgi:hypothetical protein
VSGFPDAASSLIQSGALFGEHGPDFTFDGFQGCHMDLPSWPMPNMPAMSLATGDNLLPSGIWALPGSSHVSRNSTPDLKPGPIEPDNERLAFTILTAAAFLNRCNCTRFWQAKSERQSCPIT